MNTSLDCIPCFVRQAAEAIGLCVAEPSRRAELMRSILSDLAVSDWSGVSAVVAQRIHRRIREESGNPDPYRTFKDNMNRLAMELLPGFRDDVQGEEDPEAARVRVALAGNLIDVGAKTLPTEMDIRTTLCQASSGDCMTGAARALFQAAEQAHHILFLADNAGEIVLDRVLIEALPTQRVVVGVRGSPVINDATVADAETAGLPGIVRVMPNGSDAPGTLLDDCSDEFRRVFAESDLIVAKGQGNFESLTAVSKHAFFLLAVKCPLVGRHSGVRVGSMAVCERNGASEEHWSVALVP